MTVDVIRVPSESWRATCELAVAEGARLRCLYAADGEDGPEVRLLLGLPDAERLLRTTARDGTLDSVLELLPAVGWDEREAHDVYGVRFAGHEPLRALVAHPPELERWATPVSGDGTHQVAVGPIHAGVIESGHFRFHVVGERVLHLDLRLFYKHRGLQRAAEGEPLDEASRSRSARAQPAPSPTRSPTRRPPRRSSASHRRPSSAARARSCASSSGSTTTSTTSRRSAPGSDSRPARWRSPRSRNARSSSTSC